MIRPYSVSDVIETAVVFLIVLVGCIALLVRRPRTMGSDYRYVRRPLVTAALLLLGGIAGACLVGQRWDVDYIVAYLTLHRIEHGNVFRNLAFVGYALASFGTATFILIKLNERAKSAQ